VHRATAYGSPRIHPTARCSHTLHTMVSFWLQKTALCEELLLGMNDHAQPAVCAAPARV